VRTILVGGHESADGADLVRLEVPADATAARPGRPLHDLVGEALDRGDTVVVVPMTFGRDPAMVVDTAQTLRWVAARGPGRVALTAPFGTTDHLVARLRAAANAVAATDPGAVLVALAPRSNPFDEAELHRVAYLAGAYGTLVDVVPVIGDDDETVGAALGRLARTGLDRVAVVPAGFAAAGPAVLGTVAPPGARFLGPLMGDRAVVGVVRTRVRAALDGLADGFDRIDDGLGADHGHGYAHSHAPVSPRGDQGHGTRHQHPHEHPHEHPHRPERLHA
jgi:hypothetical protein